MLRTFPSRLHLLAALPFWPWRLFFVAFAFTTLLPTLFALSPALAQDGQVSLEPLVDTVLPYVREIVFALIAILVAWAAARFRAWTGMEIEARHREALQTAMEAAAALVLDRAGSAARSAQSFPIGNATLEVGVEYLIRTVPDAVAHFGLTPQQLGERLRPRIIALG